MMKLKKIHLINYLIHRDFEIEFSSSFFELKRENEFGKSTLLMSIIDAFSLNPSSLKNKNTKGISKEPVIEVDFELNNESYFLVLNAQDDTVSLKGADGTYITTQDSIKKFFEKNGYNHFPFVVKNLLFLKERDLFIDAKSSDFRKFTKDIFNVEKINQLILTIDKIILKTKGFKTGRFSNLFKKYKEEVKLLRRNILDLEQKIDEYSENIKKFKIYEDEYRDVNSKIEKIKKELNTIKNIIIFKKIQVCKQKIDEFKKQIQRFTDDIIILNREIEKLKQERNNKEKQRIILIEAIRKADILEAKNKELDREKHIKEKLSNELKQLNSHIEEKNKSIISLSEELDKLKKEIDVLRNNKDVLQKEVLEIKIQKEKKKNFLKEIQNLDNILKKVNKLKQEMLDREKYIKPYLEYDINSLKEVLKNFELIDKLKYTSHGTVEVLGGEILVKNRLLKKGDVYSFKGEVELNKKDLRVKIFAHQEIYSIEKKIKSFIKRFKSKENLLKVIEKIEYYNSIKNELKTIYEPDMENRLNILKQTLKDIEEKIQREKRLTHKINSFNEKEKTLINNIEKKYKELNSIKEFVSSCRGKAESIKSQLDNVDIKKLKTEIKTIEEELRQMGYEDVLIKKHHLIELDNKISDVHKRLNNLQGEFFSKNEKIGFLKQEVKNISMELDRLEKEDTGIDDLPYGLVRKYEDLVVEELEALQRNMEKELLEKMDEREKVSVNIAHLKSILSNVPDIDELDKKRRGLEDVLQKLSSLEKMEKVLRVSKQVLTQLREDIEKKYLSSLSNQTCSYFSEITCGKYVSTAYLNNTIYLGGEDFVRSWRVHRGMDEFSFEELSDGTKTQLLLSIRLALISSFLGENRAFLLLDEPFAYFDLKRMQRAKNILRKLSGLGWQIILVSARE